MKISQFLYLLIVIVSALLLRLVPHPANVAPIAALALFGGAYLNKKYAVILPFVAMLISDFFLGLHNTLVFVYISFLVTVGIGIWLRSHKSVYTVVFASILSSILFFLITNFGVWFMGPLYPRTLSGLLESYYFAVPFFRNTLLGDLLYTGLFFGGHEVMVYAISSKYKITNSK